MKIVSWMLALGLATSISAAGQPTTREIDPALTAPGVVRARGGHRLIVNNQAAPNGLLLLSLGGTNSLPADFWAFDETAASLGYLVVALDYPNSVISTEARGAGNPDGFQAFREEIVVGTALSPIVEVDPPNSIEGRFCALLKAAGAEYSHFLSAGEPDWSRVVVVGHSQGSGHAAYLGKRHALKAALLLAGPQDSNEDGPSSWLSEKGRTKPEAFLALLHENDFFDCQKQLRAIGALRGSTPTVIGQDVIVLNSPAADPHMTVLDPQHQEAWRALLVKAARL